MQPHPRLEVRQVRNGRGMVALRAMAPQALVCRIEGRILGSDAVWRAWKTSPQLAANCYRFDEERYLSPRGSIAEFSNHSCHPNAAVFKERGALVLRAIRAIAPGQEVTHDYATLLGADDIWTMRCNCGEGRCRGLVRRFDALPQATLRRYLAQGLIPRYIVATAPALQGRKASRA